MSKVIVTRSLLDLLADSVSAKSGESLPLTIGEMKVAIDGIVLNSQIIGDGNLDIDENDNLYFSGEGIIQTGTISITSNGTYNVSSYASASVNVSGSSATLGTKSITANGTYNASSDSLDGYSSVTVNVEGGGNESYKTLTLNDSSLWTGNASFSESSAVGTAYATVMHTDTSGNRIVLIQPIESPSTSFSLYGNTGYAVAVCGFDSNKQYLGQNNGGYILSWTNFTTNTPISITTSANYIGIVLRKSDQTQLLPANIESVGFSIKYIGEVLLQAKTNISPSESSQTITADSGYDGLSSVQINAISSTYVGSGITQRSVSDITVSGSTINVPSGYYEEGSLVSVSSITHVKPTISVDTTTGLITATHFQSQSGYLDSGTTTATEQLSTQSGTTITPTESSQVAVSANKYTLGDVKIGAISSTYVGSGITSRSSTDLTVSGATVTAPAGYYSESASKSVASGTAGTPTASKGTVSNHQISITPSVTNTTGYITGGTKTGTAVTVTASELASGNKEITSNGTDIDVVGYSTVSVAVPGASLQAKTGINPTTSSQTITADSGYDGLSSVQINAMPTMTLPSSTSSSGSGTSKATISRSTSNQYLNIPTGYNSSAAYYTISATPNGTATAPSSISGTSATVSTGTNTITLTKTVSVTPTISTAGYISSGTAGNSSVSLTASVTTKGATTYNTSSSDQTIASGTYLTGTQTIKAVTVSGLDASKILSGTTVMIGDANDADRIASVSGTVTFSTIRTGTSAPSSSLGENGDIYVQS